MKDRKEFIANASVNIMTALLETTTHNVIEEPAIAELYAEISIRYATSLADALEKTFNNEE